MDAISPQESSFSSTLLKLFYCTVHYTLYVVMYLLYLYHMLYIALSYIPCLLPYFTIYTLPCSLYPIQYYSLYTWLQNHEFTLYCFSVYFAIHLHRNNLYEANILHHYTFIILCYIHNDIYPTLYHYIFTILLEMIYFVNSVNI